MKIKNYKKKISISRRIFNKILMINFAFLLFSDLSQKSKINEKKVKFNDHVWLLNEND
tara:strand:- start:25 stop:198 length:174 start_codon:yes stop_codon:yes gene_type:complete